MADRSYRAYICCGRECGPKGSRILLDQLAAEIARQFLDDRVSVLPTGCQSHCESGPTMVVYPGPVYYEQMDESKLRRIVKEHFLAGNPVREFFWHSPDLSPRRSESRPTADQPTSASQWKSPQERPVRPPKPKRNIEDVDDFKW